MKQLDRPDVKYSPRRCPFLSKEVWAILTKNDAKQWRIVNCLDKDEECYGEPCAFTTDGGRWPFEHAPCGPVEGG